MPSMQSLDIQDRSATTTASPQVRVAAAAGRQADRHLEVHRLQGMSGRVHAVERSARRHRHDRRRLRQPDRSDRSIVDRDALCRKSQRDDGTMEWLIRKDGCMHCEDPGCLKACPAPGAIVKYANGIVDFISENCIGCGYCIAGCPFDIPRISKKDNKAYKCSLCSDRVAVGMSPACVKTCPTGALQFGTKVDMVVRGEKRVRRSEGARLSAGRSCTTRRASVVRT